MGHQGFASRTGTRQRNIDKRMSLGLCRYCSKNVEEGKKLCSYHLQYHRKYRKEVADAP